ncbi:MAG: YibE/F family protein [Flintibacter sp.]|uniref:YibE/F family protein n=1 Tax=Flintibacter sp. TaxID=1918624 RepID=UPI00267170C8|nr:YibE/F family protein [Flintibacter sp.]MCI6150262.1 YibE/F family protein [Flintibacter sp.]MDD7117068.1 YibE/F family protein [Flintibacter sp.]MDY5039196.1 YibE/F family protein [Lawsonibacter sp.]
MKQYLSRRSVRYHAPVVVCLLAILILLLLPTGFEGALVYQEAERCTARVLSVDDSTIIDTGLVRSGEQRCQLEILDGMFQGQTVSGVNMLNGSLEQDKVFQPGDKALVVVSHDGDTITNVTMSDHYRLSWELVMAIGFAIFLILFAGPTGVRAIASFVLTVLTLWKVLVPLYLKGYNPVWIGLAITLFLTVLIIALVYGFDRRCWAAVSGSFLGILVTCVLGVLFTDLFQIHGAVMSYSESLLYSGYQDLNLTQIFMASIFIGASGAIMDLSVDITSAVYEVVEKRPDLTWWEATRSGMNVGRAAMGTMTTTLLFAYSGGYVALLMVFMAQGTPVENILNYKYVAAELIHTVIGSFGLVTVAPFTALCAGVFLTRREKKEAAAEPQQQCP